METKTGEQLRYEEIQSLAKGYPELDITGKIKLLQLLQADVKDERLKLENSLGIIDKLLGVSAASQAPLKPVMTGAGPVGARKHSPTKQNLKCTAEPLAKVGRYGGMKYE